MSNAPQGLAPTDWRATETVSPTDPL